MWPGCTLDKSITLMPIMACIDPELIKVKTPAQVTWEPTFKELGSTIRGYKACFTKANQTRASNVGLYVVPRKRIRHICILVANNSGLYIMPSQNLTWSWQSNLCSVVYYNTWIFHTSICRVVLWKQPRISITRHQRQFAGLSNNHPHQFIIERKLKIFNAQRHF